MFRWNPRLPYEPFSTESALHHPQETTSYETACPSYESNDSPDVTLQKYIKRRSRAISLAKVATASVLSLCTAVSPYLTDVRANIAAAEGAEASTRIMDKALSPENEHKATVFFHGFNTYGASYLVNKLGPGYQAAFDGNLWSVEYNNAALDATKITEMLQEKFKEKGITSVDFVLYSEGGVTGTDVVTRLLETSWEDIENVTYLSSPSSFDTLTDKTKEEIGIAKDLAWIPWIEYSTLFRLGAEAYFYRNEMQKNFANASGGIVTRYNNGDMTNNLFIGSQINDIVEAHVAKSIESWQQYADEKHIPNVNYIKIEDDIVVDNDKAIDEICPAARKIGAHCTVRVVSATHGGFFQPKPVENYDAVFAELATTVAPYTLEEANRHAFTPYGPYGEDVLLLRSTPGR